MNKKYKCVCCGNYTMENEDPLYYDICPVCYWENDPIQNDDPMYEGGANGISLLKAKENFVKYGAVKLRFKEYAVSYEEFIKKIKKDNNE